MTDFAPLTPPDTAAPSTQQGPGRASAGTLLREMREAAGVDVGLLASALKVSVQKVEALEADRLDLLPDVTFARGLASTVCRAFGVDPREVLSRMPVSAPGLRDNATAINQPFRRTGEGPAPMLTSGPSRPLLILVGLLLLAAALLWLWPTLPIQLGAPEPAPSADGTVQEGVPPPVPAVEPTAPPELAASGAAAPVASAAASASAAAAPRASQPVAAASAPATNDLVRFEATGETWVTVRDAKGESLINRALQAGEAIGVSGQLPLAVTVGRKSAVTVKVRGEPFDINGIGRSSVARFDVK
ncbi:helix-turn-helix domain-containing protein [Ottowia sp.]|uniref:helix-turn-helix domain-containing protein n=1 Tax=Ottowia sp. TaxID=1898956 RepID=UPI00263345D3|nr:helix-turn-helix domain-containing protein [Ottowia sp.]